MASPPPNSQNRVKTPSGGNAQVYIDRPPKIPQEVKDRFPSMEKYEQEMNEFFQNLNFRINGAQ